MSKFETQIEVQASELARALNLVASTVENRNTIPVLSNVHVKATQSGIDITGTDLDRWCSDFVPNAGGKAKVKPFETTLPARELHKIAKAIPGEARISISVGDGKAVLTACADMGGGKPVSYTLHTLPAEDFPMPSAFKPVAELVMPAAEIGQIIHNIGFATSTEEVRYYLNGIFLHFREGQLKTAATDGHRLAFRNSGTVLGAETLPDTIVSNKAIKLVAAMVAKQKEDVVVEASVNRICFSIGLAKLICKSIDGTFPDYTRVIPTANDILAVVDPVRLAAAVKRVQLIATEKTRAIVCEFSTGKLMLTVNSPENGTASEELAIEYVGNDLRIGFNASYLLDILARMPGDRCEIHMADPSAPSIFRLNDKAANLYVLMPMRV